MPAKRSLNDPEVFAISKVEYRALRLRLRDLPGSHLIIRVYDYVVDAYNRTGESPPIGEIRLAMAARADSPIVDAIIALVQADWLETFRPNPNSRPMFRPNLAPHGELIRDFYLWYRKFYMDNGVLPSYLKCAQHLGYRSVSAVVPLMATLHEYGYVRQINAGGAVGTIRYIPADTIIVDKQEYEALKEATEQKAQRIRDYWG